MPKTILLADDSSTIRKIVELTFSGTDIRVEAVERGSEALAYLERIQPDLILADVVMPPPTGYELCRRVKSGAAPVPVVLLSSSFEPFDEALAQQCGADRHLIKPFDSSTLKDTVHELLFAPAEAEPEPTPELRSDADAAVDALIEETALAIDAPVETPAQDVIGAPDLDLDEALIDAVSRAVVHRLTEQVVRDIAREVVPEMAERIIRERIRNLGNTENEDT
jgi:CheY-like chemotaxis protein